MLPLLAICFVSCKKETADNDRRARKKPPTMTETMGNGQNFPGMMSSHSKTRISWRHCLLRMLIPTETDR